MIVMEINCPCHALQTVGNLLRHSVRYRLRLRCTHDQHRWSPYVGAGKFLVRYESENTFKISPLREGCIQPYETSRHYCSWPSAGAIVVTTYSKAPSIGSIRDATGLCLEHHRRILDVHLSEVDHIVTSFHFRHSRDTS